MLNGIFNKLKGRVFNAPVILAFAAGIFIGWFAVSNIYEKKPSPHELRQGGYTFINPLLECEIQNDAVIFRELVPFKDRVNELVEGMLSAGRASHISVYFRDLNNGPWFGINEKEEFSPASLLKVPVMIALLKIAEDNPEVLAKEVLYDGSFDYNLEENIKPSDVMQPGKKYTIDELIYRMIAYSDNNAAELLLANIPERTYYKVYKDLGIDVPGLRKTENYMQVKTYASFFRILFNASYLNRDMSEKALGYLNKADFKGGLIAGVPINIATATKFGERKIIDADNPNIVKQIQLHDCGIVYYPQSPYLLCVMSRGSSFEMLASDIKDISRLIYEEISSQHKY